MERMPEAMVADSAWFAVYDAVHEHVFHEMCCHDTNDLAYHAH